MNRGRINEELRYFRSAFQNLIKLDNELRLQIRELDNFRKITKRRIYEITNHIIWIKIRGEINKQKLGRKFEQTLTFKHYSDAEMSLE